MNGRMGDDGQMKWMDYWMGGLDGQMDKLLDGLMNLTIYIGMNGG